MQRFTMAAALGCGLLLASSADAQITFTWVGDHSDAFVDYRNWDPEIPPANPGDPFPPEDDPLLPGDQRATLIIPKVDGHEPVFKNTQDSLSRSVKYLHVLGGATLTLTGGDSQPVCCDSGTTPTHLELLVARSFSKGGLHVDSGGVIRVNKDAKLTLVGERHLVDGTIVLEHADSRISMYGESIAVLAGAGKIIGRNPDARFIASKSTRSEVTIEGTLMITGDECNLADPCPPRLFTNAQNDCNFNGMDDDAEVMAGLSRDCNHDLIPDSCSPAPFRFENYGLVHALDVRPEEEDSPGGRIEIGFFRNIAGTGEWRVGSKDGRTGELEFRYDCSATLLNGELNVLNGSLIVDTCVETSGALNFEAGRVIVRDRDRLETK